MPQGYGMIGHIGIAKEAAWGTAVAATDYFEALSENLTGTYDWFDVRNIHGKFSPPDQLRGMRRVGGSIVLPGNARSIGFFLLGATGIQSNTTVLSGFLHRHTFTMATADNAADNPLPPFTFEIFRDVTSSQRYIGCQVAGIQLSVAPNQELRVTANILGKDYINIAKTTPSFPGSPVDPFTFDACSMQIAGAGSTLFESFNVSIDNQLDGVATLNANRLITKIRRSGFQQIGVSGTLGFENITDYQRFVNETEFTLKADFFRANSFSMLVDFPRVIYRAFPLGLSGAGRMTVGFDGVVRYSVSSASMGKIQVTNTKSGY